MGPKEIVWRTSRAFARHRERIAYRHGANSWSEKIWQQHLCPHDCDGDIPQNSGSWWLNHMRTREEPEFLLNATTLTEAEELYQVKFPDLQVPLIQRAERVCRGEFSFLGIDFKVADPIHWQRDPVTGRDWPREFHADVHVPFCDGTGSKDSAGDPKHVWELNRHEFLVDCAKAFYITGESRYARRVFQIINEWIVANPYLEGVNWFGPLEVAVRSMAWLWSYQFCRSWRGLAPEDHLAVIQSFYQHGAYLHRHIEVFTSPNNHLVGEATALYLLGSFFPEFDESRVWREQAWSILAAEPERQFYDDGGSTEQATSYHHYCLGFFLLAVLTRQLQQQHIPQTMLDRLEAACQFSMWMTTPDGTVPRIGDTDDARSIYFAASPLWDFRNLLCLGAVVFRRADFKAVSESFSEDALWLLGDEGYRIFMELAAEFPDSTSQSFPGSGYVIMRSGWGPEDHHVCFDCGPIGLGLNSKDIPIFTHGHADLLSVTIRAFGKPLLIDAGFYTYNGPPDWHRYTRDVQGHNTIRVDGRSQAKFNVANAWSCVAKPGHIRLLAEDCIEFAEGSHANFYGPKPSICHRRAIIWRSTGQWIIHDRLEGEGTHTVEVFFHFAPGTSKPLADACGVCVTTEQGISALLQLVGSDEFKVETKRGQAQPDGGWIATSYGQRVPAPFVCFRGIVTLPLTIKFLLIATPEKPRGTLIELGSRCELSSEEINEVLAMERVIAGQGIFQERPKL